MKAFYLVACFALSFCANSQQVKTSLTYSVHAPAVKSDKPPVLILLHGYGSNEADLFSFGSRLDSRFLTFSLRGPLPQNDGFCWFPITFMPGGKINYGYSEAKKSRDKILAFISNACRAYGADSTNVYVLGFSQGAIMTFELAFHSPSKIKGAMALSGRMMAETRNVRPGEALKKVKFFIAHGTDDDLVNVGGSREADSLLRSMKIPSVTFKIYPMPHTITPSELEDLRSWLQSSFSAK
jgi:phospholipase/carboxylesterase